MIAVALITELNLDFEDQIGSCLNLYPQSILWEVYPHEYEKNQVVKVLIKNVTRRDICLPPRYLKYKDEVRFQVVGELIRNDIRVSVKFWV